MLSHVMAVHLKCVRGREAHRKKKKSLHRWGKVITWVGGREARRKQITCCIGLWGAPQSRKSCFEHDYHDKRVNLRRSSVIERFYRNPMGPKRPIPFRLQKSSPRECRESPQAAFPMCSGPFPMFSGPFPMGVMYRKQYESRGRVSKGHT